MALTIIQQPSIESGAFGKNVISVSTDNINVKRIKYEMYVGGSLVATQYAPVFAYQGEITLGDPQGIFNVSGLYSSALPSYDNPISGISTTFKEIEAINHQKEVEDNITEDITSGATTAITRNIYKAVDTKYEVDTFWEVSGNERFLAYTRYDGSVVRYAFANQYIPISFYTATPATSTNITRYNAGGTTTLGTTTANNQFRVATWKVNSTYENNEIRISGSQVNLQLIIDNKSYPRTKTLYFLNLYGGWEWFNFIDYEKTVKTDKFQYNKFINHQGDTEVSQLVDGVIDEYKLYGRPLNSEYVYYLKDLITSPIVLDEEGKKVRVIDNNIDIDGEGIFEPEVTIQYIKENTINF